MSHYNQINEIFNKFDEKDLNKANPQFVAFLKDYLYSDFREIAYIRSVLFHTLMDYFKNGYKSDQEARPTPESKGEICVLLRVYEDFCFMLKSAGYSEITSKLIMPYLIHVEHDMILNFVRYLKRYAIYTDLFKEMVGDLRKEIDREEKQKQNSNKKNQ